MKSISMRELRCHADRIVEQVLTGESVTVTRSGIPVAELRPVQRRGVDRATLLQRWRHLPPLNPTAFREDLDAVLDSTL